MIDFVEFEFSAHGILSQAQALGQILEKIPLTFLTRSQKLTP